MSGLELQIAEKINKEEENKKAVAWSGYGKLLYQSEIKFQLIAQSITKELVYIDFEKDAITPELVQKAEQAAAIVKQKGAKLISDRIAITSKFDPVLARLMQPEKDINQSLKDNLTAILKAKQILKEQQKTKENKEKELKQIAQQTRIYVADMHSAICKALLKRINDVYTKALEMETSIDKLPALLNAVKQQVNASNTTIAPPKPVFAYLTQAEVDACVLENFAPWTPEQYIEGFARDIDAKFADWELALKNKQQAAKINQDEYNTTIAAIDEQKEIETNTARLDALAVPMAESNGVKPLQEIYKLAEPETLEQAQKIIDAFSVNRHLTHLALRKILPINLGVKQMIAALEKIKNDDNNFEVSGLVFTKTDKL